MQLKPALHPPPAGRPSCLRLKDMRPARTVLDVVHRRSRRTPAGRDPRSAIPTSRSENLMPPISRGFRGRPRRDVDPARVPPGQYVVNDFPVLSAGPTPRTQLRDWSFTIDGAIEGARSWNW